MQSTHIALCVCILRYVHVVHMPVRTGGVMSKLAPATQSMISMTDLTINALVAPELVLTEYAPPDKALLVADGILVLVDHLRAVG